MLKNLIPFAHAKNVFEIDVSFYKKFGIKTLFVDLDNTLASYKSNEPSKDVLLLKEKLENNGINFIITSNNTEKRVKAFASKMGAQFISKIGKPFAFGINKNISKLGLKKEEILLIGDQTTTDVLAANRAKIKCVLTDKIVEEDQPTTRFNRLFDKPIRKSLIKQNLLKEWREF